MRESIEGEERLHVWLRAIGETRFVHDMPGEPFDAVWPDVDDARWNHDLFDALDSDEAIRGLSGPGTPFKGLRGERALAVALDEGFGTGADLDSPEHALLGLYAAWVETEVVAAQRFEAFWRQHVPEGLRLTDLPVPRQREIMTLDDKPTADRSNLLAMSTLVSTMWPDHPVAEHASLARLHVEVAGPWDEQDPDHVSRILESIEMPAMREQAALLVTGVRKPTPELLDQVADMDPRQPRDALRVAAWGMARSVEMGDWERAAEWAERTEPALEGTCAQESPSAQTPCEFVGYQLRETTSRLVALGVLHAATWQQALTAEAWRCHLEAPGPRGTARTEAVWTGERWRIGGWDAPTIVTDCLDALEHTSIEPDRSMRVRLTVETKE